MIVLWLLILRGVAIEFRSHQDNPLWREFWDGVFSFASAMLALVLGTAIGNMVRGRAAGRRRGLLPAAVHEPADGTEARGLRLVHRDRRRRWPSAC